MIEIKNRTTGEVLHRVDADSLQGADLRFANLCGADLRGADLRDADLDGADLHGADLRDADLRFANLRGADLRGADLRGTIYDTQPEREKLVQELLDVIDGNFDMGKFATWKLKVLEARQALTESEASDE